MKIALISCSKTKANYACAAKELYSKSELFKQSYQFARREADRIYVLSAKHGLLHEDTVIEPYDEALKNMDRKQQLTWANGVIAAIRRECDVETDEFIILAVKDYYQDLVQYLPHYCLPLGKMQRDDKIAWLKQRNAEAMQVSNSSSPISATAITASVASACIQLHRLFNGMPRYTWDTISDIPFSNGIYILFEKGETYHEMDRVVRVGTHTAQGRLKKRLLDHFVHENHDGSIFRKNIGKAILNAYKDPYLENWTIDTSKPQNLIYKDDEKNADTEARVSKFMRDAFTFTAFQVDDESDRLRLEEAIISTLEHADDFHPSAKWSGRFSPEPIIRTCGMWLKQGLDAAPITPNELAYIQKCCMHTSPQSIDAMQRPMSTKTQAVYTTQRSHTCGKYEPLQDYLMKAQKDIIELSFSEIEKILGFALPYSARTYPAWWSGHYHCNSWRDAGYIVIDVPQGIANKRAVFEKRKP